ncbi:MAG: PDZ domain-containing protein [Acidobacteriota bacterium]
MEKRHYLIFSVLVLLFANSAFAQDASGNKENSQNKDKKSEWVAPIDSVPFTLNLGNDAYLGVYLEEVTAEKMKELNLKEERGAVISKVIEGSPAEKAGLKAKDVIISFNSRRVDSVRELQRLLGDIPAGRTVTFEIIRDGSTENIAATLGKRSANFGLFEGKLDNLKGLESNRQLTQELTEKFKQQSEEMAKRSKEFQGRPFVAPREFGKLNFDFNGRAFFGGSRLGIAVETMTDQLAEYFGVKGGKGILVTEVTENSPAAKAGLKAGDVIIEIDNKKVDGLDDLFGSLSQKSEGQIEMKVIRKGEEKKVSVTLEKREFRPIQKRRAAVFSQITDII